MAEGNPVLGNILLENRDIFEELLLNEDSDDSEFEGLDDDNLVDEDVRDVLNDSWVQGGIPPTFPTFTGNPGVINPPEEDESYVYYLQRILTDDVLDIVVQETNRYASSSTAPALPPHSRLKKWTPTTLGEIKAFVGMVIAMGLVRQLDVHDYWSTNEVLSTPFFGAVMSRDRFLNIMSFLHLSDNTTALQRGQDGYSPLQKLGLPYTALLNKFQGNYNPGQNVAIDEGMIPWRGKLNFRVYSPAKPIKYGMKMYMLCDSGNGYCSRLELYTGREGPQPAASGHGVTYDIVMHLFEPYLNKGYHLYTDNYYSSPVLFAELYLNTTLACGTLRSNRRGVPQALKDTHPAKGEMSVYNNGTLVALKFADKKDVSFLTTIHEGVMKDTGKRDQDGNSISKPDCVLSYNKYMGAVDRCDQMVSYSGFDRRTLKWWKKVFFHVLGLAMLNAYILYKEVSQRPVLQRVFSISRDLPSVKSLAQHVDVDAVEAAFSTLGPKYMKRAQKTDTQPSPGPSGDMIIQKAKRKKTKKGKLPKNLDAEQDPERWLPRRERSYYRGKRKDKKKDIGKGTQGSATLPSGDMDASKGGSGSEASSPRPGSAPSPMASAAAAALPQGPRQQKPAQAQKKKKKKGSKW